MKETKNQLKGHSTLQENIKSFISAFLLVPSAIVLD